MKYYERMEEVWNTLRNARDAFCDWAYEDEQRQSGDLANFYSQIIDLEDGYLELTDENIDNTLELARIILAECK